MTREPNTDLLLRQRTFSIDETREQLRQGRPVHKDAVIGGAVDYESMFFGDVSPTANSVTPAAVTPSNKPAAKAPAGSGSWAGILMKSGPAPEAAPKTAPSTAAPSAGNTSSPKKPPAAAIAAAAPTPVSGSSAAAADAQAGAGAPLAAASSGDAKAAAGHDAEKKSEQVSCSFGKGECCGRAMGLIRVDFVDYWSAEERREKGKGAERRKGVLHDFHALSRCLFA
jgi:hypothetical protein